MEREIYKRKSDYEEYDGRSSKGKAKAARLSPEEALTVEELLSLERPKHGSPPPLNREAKKKPLIDEDDLLLNAARMAANTLARGARLWDDTPRFRESITGVTTPYSEQLSRSHRSASLDGLHTTVNGYDVALAPPTPLGLGRTISRTEQRIRLTGAKGLAFKPVVASSSSPSGKGKQKRKKRS